MLGVLIGLTLLIILIGLVVLQGMIEWGGFDPDKFFKKGDGKSKKAGKTAEKPAKKASKKPVKAAKKGKGRK
jgi:hypothetical protein